MVINLKGPIKKIFKEKQLNDNVTVQDFVVTIDEGTKYSQDILVSCMNEKIDLLKKHKEGELVMLRCNLRGKEKQGKYYNMINMFDIMGGTSN